MRRVLLFCGERTNSSLLYTRTNVHTYTHTQTNMHIHVLIALRRDRVILQEAKSIWVCGERTNRTLPEHFAGLMATLISATLLRVVSFKCVPVVCVCGCVRVCVCVRVLVLLLNVIRYFLCLGPSARGGRGTSCRRVPIYTFMYLFCMYSFVYIYICVCVCVCIRACDYLLVFICRYVGVPKPRDVVRTRPFLAGALRARVRAKTRFPRRRCRAGRRPRIRNYVRN